jgi:hypothetical protein
MNRIIFIFSVMLALTVNSYSQKVTLVQNESQADIRVFVVNDISQCDLKVFPVNRESLAIKDGLWFVGDYDSPTDVKVFFSDFESLTDIKICYVEYDVQAGWKNPVKEKMYHLKGK